MKLKEVADAGGFTAATLCCYEQIGLPPEPSRTAVGYRSHERHTVDRLTRGDGPTVQACRRAGQGRPSRGVAIAIDSRGVALEVRTPADAAPMVASLFGAAS
jgi:hypothetical protein